MTTRSVKLVQPGTVPENTQPITAAMPTNVSRVVNSAPT